MRGAGGMGVWGMFVLAGLFAASALAGGAVQTRSETVTVMGGELGSATATCKQGTRAMSGGFEAEYDPDAPTGPFFIPSESWRDGRRGWTTAARNLFAFGDPGDLTSFAYCRDERVSVRSATTSVNQDQFGSVTAKCRPGQHVLSGAFAAEADAVRVTASRKTGKRKWFVEGFNDGSGTGELTGYVQCHQDKARTAKTAEVTLSGGQGFDNAEATCPRKRRAVSGGFDVEGATDDVAETLVMQSRKAGTRGWDVAALDNGGDDVTLIAYVYCEKRKKKG